MKKKVLPKKSKKVTIIIILLIVIIIAGVIKFEFVGKYYVNKNIPSYLKYTSLNETLLEGQLIALVQVSDTEWITKLAGVKIKFNQESGLEVYCPEGKRAERIEYYSYNPPRGFGFMFGGGYARSALVCQNQYWIMDSPYGVSQLYGPFNK